MSTKKGARVCFLNALVLTVSTEWFLTVATSTGLLRSFYKVDKR